MGALPGYRLDAFRLENFMGFEDTGWIELRPITLLFGRNSSGKSAIIRALLLLKQSLEARDPDAPLRLTGPLVDLGTYYNAVHRHDTKLDIAFWLRISHPDWPEPQLPKDATEEEEQRFDAEMSERRSAVPPWTQPSAADIDDRPLELRLAFGLIEEGHAPRLKSLQIWGYRSGTPLLVFGVDYNAHERAWGLPRSEAPLDYDASVPLEEDGRPVMDEDGKQKRVTRQRQQFSDPLWQAVSPTFVDGIVPDLRTANRADIRLEDSPGDWRIVSEALRFFGEHVNGLLRKTVYLPPLREAPQRYYRAGEAWVQALVDPAGSLSKEAVNWWLAVASLDAKVDVVPLNQDEGLVGVYLFEEWDEAPTGFRSNLRDVGAGVAQVLPVIVETMRAGPDGLVIIEQPELHLHPEAQAALADFFIALSKLGVGPRFLLETHSSSLIYRMRRRMAETKVGWLEAAPEIKLRPDDISACFVNRRDGVSVLEPISYRDDGSYARMPDGFDDFFGADYEQLYRLRDAQLEAESREDTSQ